MGSLNFHDRICNSNVFLLIMPSRPSSVYNIGKLIGVKETVEFMINKGSQIKNKVHVENVVIISVKVNCSPTCGGG